VSGRGFPFGDDLGHRAMFPECPAFASCNISGGHRGLDAPPSTMRWEADHSVPNAGTGAAALAGRGRIRRRADRDAPSGRCVPWQ
jgi:hypothetical protein